MFEIPEHVVAFLREYIDSVDQVEILLLLKSKFSLSSSPSLKRIARSRNISWRDMLSRWRLEHDKSGLVSTWISFVCYRCAQPGGLQEAHCRRPAGSATGAACARAARAACADDHSPGDPE